MLLYLENRNVEPGEWITLIIAGEKEVVNYCMGDPYLFYYKDNRLDRFSESEEVFEEDGYKMINREQLLDSLGADSYEIEDVDEFLEDINKQLEDGTLILDEEDCEFKGFRFHAGSSIELIDLYNYELQDFDLEDLERLDEKEIGLEGKYILYKLNEDTNILVWHTNTQGELHRLLETKCNSIEEYREEQGITFQY